jgi:hypothetical protein
MLVFVGRKMQDYCGVALALEESALVLTGRATRVPYRRVNHGTERATTVITIRLLSWPCHALPG